MRVRRVVAAVAVVGLAASGCSSEPQGGELDLEGDDVAAAPVHPDPPVEVSEEPPEPPEPPEDEPLYPPLPPLEPDPDSDVSIEDQEYFYELYARYNSVKNEALATGKTGSVALDEVAAHGELEALEGSLARYRADGVVLSFADSRSSWVRVVEVDGGRGIVQECRVEGPASGRVDAETDEPVGERTAGLVARILQARFELVELEDGSVDHRVVEFLAAKDEDLCRA